MKSTTVVLSALLAAAAIAQPHRGHFARHQKHKRDQAVEWVTEWVTDFETVGYTTTVWVSPGYVEPTSSSSASTTKATSSTTNVPAQFFQGATKSTTSSDSPVYVTPVPVTTATSVYVPPVPTTSSTSSTSTSVYVPPVVETPTSSTPAAAVATEPVVVAPVAITTADVPVVVQTTTSTAAPAATTTSSSGSNGGACSSGSPCAGDLTHYDAGLGACGWTNNGDAENVVALAHEYMGTKSNGNPFCGKTMTIKSTKTGKKTTAMVVDKCMGCVGYDIDLSNKAFAELDDMGTGREGATWWWN